MERVVIILYTTAQFDTLSIQKLRTFTNPPLLLTSTYATTPSSVLDCERGLRVRMPNFGEVSNLKKLAENFLF